MIIGQRDHQSTIWAQIDEIFSLDNYAQYAKYAANCYALYDAYNWIGDND